MVIPAIPNFSISTLATLELRKPGRVGPKWMFLMPKDSSVVITTHEEMMMDYYDLSKTILFQGTTPEEVETMLNCLGAER